MNLTWKNLQFESFGPQEFRTDFGACCTFIPHLNMKPINYNLTTEEVYHGLKSEALHGKENGLEFILNAEQFNYAYYDTNLPTPG